MRCQVRHDARHVRIVAGTLAITATLAIGQIASAGFDNHYGEVQMSAAEPSSVVSSSPSPAAPHSEEATSSSSTKEPQPKDPDKERALLSSTVVGPLPSPPYPDGYPMVVFGDSTMSLAPTTKQVKNPLSNCKNFAGTWPHRISAQLNLPMADLSCGRAKSSQYWKFDARKYVGPATRLVLLTYGSNDMGVVNQLFSDNAFPRTGPYLHHPQQRTVEEDLTNILQDIRFLAPKAMILTVGYLPLVEGKSCKKLPNMTSAEMERVQHLRRAADEALSIASIRAADYSVAVMNSHGVPILTSGVFNIPFRDVTGHSLCAADDERFILNHEKVGSRYHYTELGLQYIAQAVERRYLAELPRWNEQVARL